MSSEPVDVHVYGALQKRFGAPSPFQAVRRQVVSSHDSRIQDILVELGIEPNEVSHLFLNGEYSAAGRRVRPGDRLAVFGRDMALLYRQYFRKVTDPP
ncbi:MAG: hypothetical protein QME77_02255 [bacterium]|nr:hypothetical protein [bacterium]